MDEKQQIQIMKNWTQERRDRERQQQVQYANQRLRVGDQQGAKNALNKVSRIDAAQRSAPPSIDSPAMKRLTRNS